jgi:DNA-binding SARP family transcriptional activator
MGLQGEGRVNFGGAGNVRLADRSRSDERPQTTFFLFGRFQAFRGGDDLGGFDRRRIQELVSYLILFPERSHHREVVSETLWGDASGDAKKNLRQALWQLRGSAKALQETEQLLLVEAEWIQLNPSASVWVDVWELQNAYAHVRGTAGEQLNGDEGRSLQRVVDLYRADLLEGWYQDWCVFERERLKTLYLALVDKLLGYCEAQGLPEDGLFYGERILAHDRAHERTHWRMMRLHWLAHDRIRALRQFKRCEAALKDELDVGPSAQTVALFERIRDETLSFNLSEDA